MLCVNCGKLLKSGAAYCRYCGAKIAQSQPEQEKKQPPDIVIDDTNNERPRGISLIKPEDMIEKKAEPIVSEVPLDNEDCSPTRSFTVIKEVPVNNEQKEAVPSAPPIVTTTNIAYTQPGSYSQQGGFGQQGYSQTNSFAQQNGFAQQGYAQPNNFGQQGYPQANNYQQNYQQAPVQNTAAGGRKDKKPLIIAISVLACLAVVGVIFAVVFKKSEAEKILSAFNKTLTAKSFRCTGSASDDRESIDFSGEILGDGKYDQIYLSVQLDDEDEPEEFAFANGKMYTKYYDHYDDVCYDEIEDEDTAEALTKLCRRDFKEAAETDREFEQYMKRICKNYDEVPEILSKMLNDCAKTKGNVSFIESYSKTGDRYDFEIDLEKFIKAAKKDYGLKLDNDIYDDLKRADYPSFNQFTPSILHAK